MTDMKHVVIQIYTCSNTDIYCKNYNCILGGETLSYTSFNSPKNSV